METNDKERPNPKSFKGDFEAFKKMKVEIDRMITVENALRSCSNECEICEQIIEPNTGHGYDHFGDIATTMSLTYNRLELKDTYQNGTCPETYSTLVIEDMEDIASLVEWAKIDVSDTENLLDNLFQALTDYASSNGFHCGADFRPLFDELKLEYNFKN